MKRNVMTRAHAIARTMEGDYRARLSLALRIAWEEEKVGNTKFEVQKSFGKVTIEIVEQEAETQIRYQIDGNKWLNARELNEARKALIFWTSQEIKIDGKIQKVGGFTLPNFDEVKAAFDMIEKERQEKVANKKAQKIAAIKSGKEKIKTYYHDGEYLSGHTLHGEEADLLAELKLCKYVSGWGYRVESELVKTLGEEFTYPQAYEFYEANVKPALDAKAAKKAAKEAERAAKFNEAKETGKPVVLRRWSEECNDPNEECDIDNLTEYAMPDGTTKVERHHTW